MIRVGAAVLGVLSVAAGITGLVLLITGRAGSNGDDPVSQFIFFIGSPVNAAVGALLAVRLPRHWAGWTLLVVGVTSSFDVLCQGVISHWQVHERWTSGLIRWAAWFDDWLWPTYFASLLFIVLKFAGQEHATRWLRRIGWCGMGVFAAVQLVAMSVRDGVDGKVDTAINLGVSLDSVQGTVQAALAVALACLVCALVSMVVHWRRATGIERAQVRWLLWSFTTVVVVIVLQTIVSGVFAALDLHSRALDDVLSVVQELSTLTIPFAVYVSVTRFGLFEIDRVVSRTATYSVLTVALTIGYALIVTSATRLLPDRLGSLGVAGATLAVAALFLPIRRRLLAVMDRRFNRTRVDAERVVSAFAERMRRDDTVDAQGGDLLRAVGAVFQPASASVWLVRA